MKKLLIATLATVMTTSAMAMSPVNKAQMEEFMDKIVPGVKIALACESEGRFELVEAVMNLAYKRFATEQFDRQLIDIQYDMSGMNPELSQYVRMIKNNPEHPEVVKACAVSDEMTLNSLKAIKDSLK